MSSFLTCGLLKTAPINSEKGPMCFRPRNLSLRRWGLSKVLLLRLIKNARRKLQQYIKWKLKSALNESETWFQTQRNLQQYYIEWKLKTKHRKKSSSNAKPNGNLNPNIKRKLPILNEMEPLVQTPKGRCSNAKRETQLQPQKEDPARLNQMGSQI